MFYVSKVLFFQAAFDKPDFNNGILMEEKESDFMKDLCF
jgi:hypothetical protein